MSDMVHFYREAETEAYTAGYSAGAATVLRKISWPEPQGKRWVNGFERGQKAGLEVIDFLARAVAEGEEGVGDRGMWIWVNRMLAMVQEYCDERALEDLGTGRAVDEPTEAA